MLSYTTWLAYEAAMMIPNIRSGKTRFVDELIDMAILMLFDYLPILIVLAAHFNNH